MRACGRGRAARRPRRVRDRGAPRLRPTASDASRSSASSAASAVATRFGVVALRRARCAISASAVRAAFVCELEVVAQGRRAPAGLVGVALGGFVGLGRGGQLDADVLELGVPALGAGVGELDARRRECSRLPRPVSASAAAVDCGSGSAFSSGSGTSGSGTSGSGTSGSGTSVSGWAFTSGRGRAPAGRAESPA